MSQKFEQYIICVETTSEAKTDRYYIKAILDKYYSVGSNKISYVFMNGKHRYNNLETIKQIDEYRNSYRGKSTVIYVFDKDKSTYAKQDSNFVEKVTTYCQKNEYHLVWFVETIEIVMIGNKISQKNKIDEARKFAVKNKILDVDIINLKAAENVNSKGKSNFMTVFDRFKKIKKK